MYSQSSVPFCVCVRNLETSHTEHPRQAGPLSWTTAILPYDGPADHVKLSRQALLFFQTWGQIVLDAMAEDKPNDCWVMLIQIGPPEEDETYSRQHELLPQSLVTSQRTCIFDLEV